MDRYPFLAGLNLYYVLLIVFLAVALDDQQTTNAQQQAGKHFYKYKYHPRHPF